MSQRNATPYILDSYAQINKKDKIVIAKVNIDENPNVPAKYQIRSIPTLMLFKDGEVLAQKLGSMPKQDLTNFLDTNL